MSTPSSQLAKGDRIRVTNEAGTEYGHVVRIIPSALGGVVVRTSEGFEYTLPHNVVTKVGA